MTRSTTGPDPAPHRPPARPRTGLPAAPLTRRRFGAAAAGGAALAGLTACGGDSGSSDGSVRLSLWDTDTRPERTENIKELITMFQAANPGIAIDYLGLPTDQYLQKIATAIATRATPDLLTPKASDIAALVTQGALEPLDDRFAAAGLAGTISPAMTASSKAAAPDGKLYLTPATSLADVVYYRADWFAEAGLPEPATWDDFDTAAQVLTDASTGRFGYTLRGGNGFFAQFVEMVYPRAGVDVFFTEDGTSTLDDPSVVTAAEDYVALFGRQTAASDLTADFKAMIAQFGAGSAAMLSHSIGSYPTLLEQLSPEQVKAVVPFPAADGRLVLTGRMTTGFGMFAASEEKDAAWKFLEFTMGAEGNGFWAQHSGYLPGNTEVAGQDWVRQNQPMQAAIAAESAPGARTLEQPYHLPEFTAITVTDMLPQWQKVLKGDLPVAEFLGTAAAQLTAAQREHDQGNR